MVSRDPAKARLELGGRIMKRPAWKSYAKVVHALAHKFQADRDRLRLALELVKRLVFDDATALTKTLWVPETVHPNETLLEHIEAALASKEESK